MAKPNRREGEYRSASCFHYCQTVTFGQCLPRQQPSFRHLCLKTYYRHQHSATATRTPSRPDSDNDRNEVYIPPLTEIASTHSNAQLKPYIATTRAIAFQVPTPPPCPTQHRGLLCPRTPTLCPHRRTYSFLISTEHHPTPRLQPSHLPRTLSSLAQHLHLKRRRRRCLVVPRHLLLTTRTRTSFARGKRFDLKCESSRRRLSYVLTHVIATHDSAYLTPLSHDGLMVSRSTINSVTRPSHHLVNTQTIRIPPIVAAQQPRP